MKKLLLICLLLISSFHEVKSQPYPQNYYGNAYYPQYPNYQSPQVMNSYGGMTAQDILSGNYQYQPYNNQGESFWSKTGRVLGDPAFVNALSGSMQNYLMQEQARTQALSNSLNSVFQNSFHRTQVTNTPPPTFDMTPAKSLYNPNSYTVTRFGDGWRIRGD